MDELRTLLEAEETIKEKISGALETLAKWFNEKIAAIRASFTELKNRAKDKLKGAAPEERAEINKAMGEIKSAGDEAIRDCKEGIQAAKGGEAGKARDLKNKVMKGLAAMSAAAAVIGGAVAAKKHMDKKKNGNLPAVVEEVEIEEIPLEEEISSMELTEGVSDVVKSLREWFKEKRIEIKNKFNELKTGVLKKLNKHKLEAEDQAKVRKAMNDAKDACDDALAGCKEGLEYLEDEEIEEAKSSKQKVVEGLLALASCAVLIRNIYKSNKAIISAADSLHKTAKKTKAARDFKKERDFAKARKDAIEVNGKVVD